jgi:beta-glucosidase
VPALIHAGYPGQQFGRALADVIFGDVAPSGKLAVTWPARLEDTAAYGSYPGEARDGEGARVVYTEGLHLGHRHFDRCDVAPLFEFGHGLTYTTFAYGEPVVTTTDERGVVTIALPVTNTGELPGTEIVQLYVSHDASAVDRPVRELRGFARVTLAAGETRTAVFSLRAADLAYWSVGDHRWVVEDGAVTVAFGASSRDLRVSVVVDPRPPISNQIPVSTEGEQP